MARPKKAIRKTSARPGRGLNTGVLEAVAGGGEDEDPGPTEVCLPGTLCENVTQTARETTQAAVDSNHSGHTDSSFFNRNDQRGQS